MTQAGPMPDLAQAQRPEEHSVTGVNVSGRHPDVTENTVNDVAESFGSLVIRGHGNGMTLPPPPYHLSSVPPPPQLQSSAPQPSHHQVNVVPTPHLYQGDGSDQQPESSPILGAIGIEPDLTTSSSSAFPAERSMGLPVLPPLDSHPMSRPPLLQQQQQQHQQQ